ncbi:hypothetical protein [Kalamiella sp. sgz302252]|uniref:hypothetical protein n=1 Tax=Pantoea sp. sgz302252 TaxID=3341827 RepID=UPI0036D3A7C0
MRELKSFECFKVGGAGTAKLTLDDIKAMLEDNYTTQKIGAIGLKTATEEAKPSWGNNVAGDAGYYYLANGRVTRWFFDGAGYFTE